MAKLPVRERTQSTREIAETAAPPAFPASEPRVAVLDKPIGYGSANRTVIVYTQCHGEGAWPQCGLEKDAVAAHRRWVFSHLPAGSVAQGGHVAHIVEEESGGFESAGWNDGGLEVSAGVTIGLNGKGFGRIRRNVEQRGLVVGSEISLEESGSKTRRNRQSE
jgi:hypothetical protein